MSFHAKSAQAALTVLGVLQVVMLGSLYAGVPPHPPQSIALFGIAPFLAVSLSVIAASIILGPLDSRWGRGLAVASALCALLSFGPQKYFDAQFPLIWPTVVTAQLAAGVIFYILFRERAQSRAELGAQQ